MGKKSGVQFYSKTRMEEKLRRKIITRFSRVNHVTVCKLGNGMEATLHGQNKRTNVPFFFPPDFLPPRVATPRGGGTRQRTLPRAAK